MLKWPTISPGRAKPIRGNKYSDWKDDIAVHCQHRCIYCAILDNFLGGSRAFHVEHFRPKSLFEDLEDDIKNLFYACCICNSFKGDDWHDDAASIQYISPYENYNNYFKLQENCLICGENDSAKYMIEKLGSVLNLVEI